MGKKLQGDFFFLSANDLKTGEVVFLTKNGWSQTYSHAIKIHVNDIEKFEEICKKDEKECIIISPKFVELDEAGNIKTLRDKIRKSGLTFKI